MYGGVNSSGGLRFLDFFSLETKQLIREKKKKKKLIFMIDIEKNKMVKFY